MPRASSKASRSTRAKAAKPSVKSGRGKACASPLAKKSKRASSRKPSTKRKKKLTVWFDRSGSRLSGGISRTARSATNAGPTEAVRRWSGAATNRLNSKHWSNVTSNAINTDLQDHLSDLRDRSEYEASMNGFVSGVIRSHAIDVVGKTGPKLQVLSDNEAYNERVEAIWSQWWSMPDINGQWSGVEFLKLWDRLMWTCGEYLIQKVTDTAADGWQKFRIHNIAPRRLVSPIGYSDDVILGIKRDKRGKPLEYYVLKYDKDRVAGSSLDTDPLKPEDVLHRFEPIEPGQVRGVPWLAPVLQTMADLHDCDEQVLDAIRAAADQAVVFFTEHPDATYFEIDATVEIERRTMSTIPPGWKPQQLKPEQPGTKYVEYRYERLRELGRVVNMPLMIVLLDSQKHSFSSARFDSQLYVRGIESFQNWVETRTLNVLLGELVREASVARQLPRKPKKVTYNWSWPKLPAVDRYKEGLGDRVGLEDGTVAVSDVIDTDLDTHISKIGRETKAYEKAGLSHPHGRKTGRTVQKSSKTKDGDKKS